MFAHAVDWSQYKYAADWRPSFAASERSKVKIAQTIGRKTPVFCSPTKATEDGLCSSPWWPVLQLFRLVAKQIRITPDQPAFRHQYSSLNLITSDAALRVIRKGDVVRGNLEPNFRRWIVTTLRRARSGVMSLISRIAQQPPKQPPDGLGRKLFFGSYRKSLIIEEKWWTRQGSNLRPVD
jgi:hypothetical protein